ncbi:MAG: hypothetical protein HY302_01785 [Opitutae bacterium]|nr:hypothetical protein [Opitutae bacterium]
MAEKSSNVPLWLTLGFAGGLAFGWMLLRQPAKTPPPPAETVPVEAVAVPDGAPKDVATLGATEQYFQRWGGYAVWENQTTQFAVWNGRKQRHSDFYEVRRADGKFFFRTLPQLSWVLLDHGPKMRAPIWFAETVAMRAQFYQAHPDYDPSKEPAVKLPPLPPIAHLELEPRVMPTRRVTTPSTTTTPMVRPPPPPVVILTPGAGGG